MQVVCRGCLGYPSWALEGDVQFERSGFCVRLYGVGTLEVVDSGLRLGTGFALCFLGGRLVDKRVALG